MLYTGKPIKKTFEQRYLEHRKKSVIRIRNLLVQRDQVNREIREIQRQIKCWDTALANKED